MLPANAYWHSSCSMFMVSYRGSTEAIKITVKNADCVKKLLAILLVTVIYAAVSSEKSKVMCC